MSQKVVRVRDAKSQKEFDIKKKKYTAAKVENMLETRRSTEAQLGLKERQRVVVPWTPEVDPFQSVC